MNTTRQYRCGFCGALGHQARSCPKNKPALPALSGQDALRAMLSPMVAVYAVLAGPNTIQDALLNALRAEQESPFPIGNALSNAYAELLTRARELAPEVVEEAQKRFATLQEAQAAYDKSFEAITTVLYPKAR